MLTALTAPGQGLGSVPLGKNSGVGVGVGGDSFRSGSGGGSGNNNSSGNVGGGNIGGGNITDGAVGGPLAVMTAEQYRTLNRKTPFSSSWGDLFRYIHQTHNNNNNHNNNNTTTTTTTTPPPPPPTTTTNTTITPYTRNANASHKCRFLTSLTVLLS